jgi:hypothetical protein
MQFLSKMMSDDNTAKFKVSEILYECFHEMICIVHKCIHMTFVRNSFTEHLLWRFYVCII